MTFLKGLKQLIGKEGHLPISVFREPMEPFNDPGFLETHFRRHLGTRTLEAAHDHLSLSDGSRTETMCSLGCETRK